MKKTVRMCREELINDAKDREIDIRVVAYDFLKKIKIDGGDDDLESMANNLMIWHLKK